MTSVSMTAVDCFAGAGGASLGAAWAGFDVRAAFDLNERAVETYGKNLLGHVVQADVMDLTGAGLLSLGRLAQGECDLLIGGPPCQGFSVQRRGADTDERNALVGEFLRLVAESSPRAFMMENVPALAGRRGVHLLNEFTAKAAEFG